MFFLLMKWTHQEFCDHWNSDYKSTHLQYNAKVSILMYEILLCYPHQMMLSVQWHPLCVGLNVSIVVAWYICCMTWSMWQCIHNLVIILIVDGPVPVYFCSIWNHCNDIHHSLLINIYLYMMALTHWGLNKADHILQGTLLKHIFFEENYDILMCISVLFLMFELTICKHCLE